jgi:acetyl-CoA carboxylase carboxyl transferase subunit beta
LITNIILIWLGLKKKEKGITTATEDKMDVPKGLWYKSPTGKIIDADELERTL